MKDFDLPPSASIGFVPHAGIAIRRYGESTLSTGEWTIPAPDEGDRAWLAHSPRMIPELTHVPEVLPYAITDRTAFLAWLAANGGGAANVDAGEDQLYVGATATFEAAWEGLGSKADDGTHQRVEVVRHDENDHLVDEVHACHDRRAYQQVLKIDPRGGTDTYQFCHYPRDRFPTTYRELWDHVWQVLGHVGQSMWMPAAVTVPRLDLRAMTTDVYLGGMRAGNRTVAEPRIAVRLRSDAPTVPPGPEGSRWDDPAEINGPFLLIIQRRGMQIPVFAALIRPDAWKRL